MARDIEFDRSAAPGDVDDAVEDRLACPVDGAACCLELDSPGLRNDREAYLASIRAERPGCLFSYALLLIGKGGLYGNVIRTGLMLNSSVSTVDELVRALDAGLALC